MKKIKHARRKHLTPRKFQLLKMINSFLTKNFYSPTIAELASNMQLSRSTIFEHIEELKRKELLSALPGRARSLKLTSKALKLLKNVSATNRKNTAPFEQTIRLAGEVAAGLPIEAIENTETLTLSSHFGNTDELFALEVQGDSMLDEDIRDGDIVICRKSPVADNGQLVVAIVENNNATLKKFYKEKNSVRLQPANKKYEPIYSSHCRVEAVVTGLIRKL